MTALSPFAVRAYRAARVYQSPPVALRDALSIASMGRKGRRSWSGRARVRRYFAHYAAEVQPVATLRLHYGNAPTGTTDATAWHGVPVTYDERRSLWVTHERRDGGVVVLAWHRTPGAAEVHAAGIACRRFAVPVEDEDEW